MAKGELNHITFIPDGNGRWAKENGYSSDYAYKQGAERAREAMEGARDHDIHTASFWGLSTDNWRSRSGAELAILVGLFGQLTDNYLEDSADHDVRVVHLGRKDRLPAALVERLVEVEEVTADNTGHVLNLALDYGGQDEIHRATRRVVEAVQAGELTLDELEEQVGVTSGQPITRYAHFLDTGDQPHPYPDLVVRTSGEQRTSGWMPYQSGYAELVFPSVYWPEFDRAQLDMSIDQFNTRTRRFGNH